MRSKRMEINDLDVKIVVDINMWRCYFVSLRLYSQIEAFSFAAV